MKILFVVPYVPNLIRTRPYNLIRYLARRGHQVTVATLWADARERGDLDQLRPYCEELRAIELPSWRSLVNCVRALPGGDPLQARYSWSTELLAQIHDVAASVDLVHVEHLRGAHYALALATAAAGTPVVWDSVDCITHLFDQAARRRTASVGRFLNRFELSRTRRFEAAMVRRLDRVLVTSRVDRDALLALGAADGNTVRSTVTVLGNGVDLDYFSPGDERRDADTVVFSGKMSYHANESAVLHLVREIMPRIWATHPATRLVVVGKDPSPTLRRLLAADPRRLVLTGTVADLRPYLRRAAISVVPLVYGAGCQNKVLEAMACATPVVATPQAVSALNARPGEDVLVGDGAAAFADAVVTLLHDVQRQRAVGDAGRRYVETHHRWDHIASRLEAVYEQVIASRGEHAGERQASLLTA